MESCPLNFPTCGIRSPAHLADRSIDDRPGDLPNPVAVCARSSLGRGALRCRSDGAIRPGAVREAAHGASSPVTYARLPFEIERRDRE